MYLVSLEQDDYSKVFYSLANKVTAYFVNYYLQETWENSTEYNG